MEATKAVGSAIKSGVTTVGSTMVSVGSAAVPQLAGAVDIMVVRQRDGSLKSSPFYVRFGKYQGLLRTREKRVNVSVNGQDAEFSMHLGRTGEAYFVTEDDATGSDTGGEEAEKNWNELDGMVSPPSGYSSGEDADLASGPPIPYATVESSAPLLPEELELCGGLWQPDGEEGRAEGEGAKLALINGEVPTKSEGGGARGVEDVASEATAVVGGEDGGGEAPSCGTPPTASKASSFFGFLKRQKDVLSPPSSPGPSPMNSSRELTGSAAASPARGAASRRPPTGAGEGGDGGGGGAAIGGGAAGGGAEGGGAGVTSSLTTAFRSMTDDGEGPAVAEGRPSSDASSAAPSSAEPSPAGDALVAEVEGGTPWAPGTPATPRGGGEASSPGGGGGVPWDGVAGGSGGVRDVLGHSLPQPIERGSGLLGSPGPLRSAGPETGGAGLLIGAPTSRGGPAGIPAPHDVITHFSWPPPPGWDPGPPTPSPSTDLHAATTGWAPGVGAALRVGLRDPDPEDAATEASTVVLGGVGGSLRGGGGGGGSRAVVELSLCGGHLRADMAPGEVEAVFEAHRVGDAEAYLPRLLDVASSPHLWVRVAGCAGLYPAAQAVPILLGALAFGLPPAQVEQRLQEQLRGKVGKGKEEKEGKGWSRIWPWSRSTTSSKPAEGDAAAAGEHPPATPATAPAGGAAGARRAARRRSRVRTRRTLKPRPEQLSGLPLREGQNIVTFTFSTTLWGTQQVQAYMYLYNWNSRVVISDVDGTITKSDMLGHFLPMVGKDWSHSGVTNLFTSIKANGYEVMFLSARAIAQASVTRDYLQSLHQHGATLPAGPVIMSPDGLLPSLYREVVLRRPQDFKIACLQDIRSLWPDDWNPFYAGFGNRPTDEISYAAVGIPHGKIFIINPRGEVRLCMTAVQSSTWSTLQGIHQLVDDMFPPLPRPETGATPEWQGQGEDMLVQEQFNDLNYWRSTSWVDLDDEIAGAAASPGDAKDRERDAGGSKDLVGKDKDKEKDRDNDKDKEGGSKEKVVGGAEEEAAGEAGTSRPEPASPAPKPALTPALAPA